MIELLSVNISKYSFSFLLENKIIITKKSMYFYYVHQHKGEMNYAKKKNKLHNHQR